MHIITFLFIFTGIFLLLKLWKLKRSSTSVKIENPKKFQSIKKKIKEKKNSILTSKKSSLEVLLDNSFEWPKTFDGYFSNEEEIKNKNNENLEIPKFDKINKNSINSEDLEIYRLMKKIK